MYDNIGKKIKGLAMTIFIIEAIAAVIAGIFYIAANEYMLLGLLTMAGGFLVAWISSWFLYGFGELIDKVCDIARNMHKVENTSKDYTTTFTEYRPQTTEYVQTIEYAQTNIEKDVNKGTPPVSAVISNGEKVCPKCGTTQRADRSVCWSCGQHFDN